jgi:iron(III) transport system permease protein
MVRTDLPGRRLIEPLILVPIFVSPMVLGFGYVVAAGPVGFLSQWAQALIGFVPWNIYDMSSIVVIAGLTHVPHAYLYISSALRSVGSDVEEAARTAGASPWQVMTSVSLPMVRPSILYATVLLFFLGLEVFGLMLVLGDPEGNMVLATYLYKLTNKLGTPSYHLMAAVAVVLICITIPLVMLQRRLMRTANRFVTMKGKASQARALPLGKWRWVAGAVVAFWLTVTIGVPLLGVVLRAFISNWGVGVSLWDELSEHLPHHLGAAQPAARHRQLHVYRRDWRRAGRGVLPVCRHCHAPQTGQHHAFPGLQRAGAARRAGPAGGSGVPVGVPVPADVAG